MLTASVKVAVTSAPLGSLAVTVTLYGPDPLAALSIVPEINPVAGSMLRPAGRPVAEYVNVSPFGSLNAPAVARLNAPASVPVWFARPVVTGVAFCTVIVTVAVAVPPFASATWYVKLSVPEKPVFGV